MPSSSCWTPPSAPTRVCRRSSPTATSWSGPAGILHYGFDSEVVNFDRDIGVTGWRLDLRPDATLHFEGPGYFVRTGLAYEFTQYSLDHTAPGQDRNPRRSLPTGSVDTGLLFERAVGATAAAR